MNTNITLVPLDLSLVVCQLENTAELPEWANDVSNFYPVTRTSDELSLVCSEKCVPVEISGNIEIEPGWKAFKVQGKLNLNCECFSNEKSSKG
ncbi:MAG: hypothetical protein ACOCZR_04855 [Halanaerobiales bacterium]